MTITNDAPLLPGSGDHVIAVVGSAVGRVAAWRTAAGALVCHWLAEDDRVDADPAGPRDDEEQALADGLAGVLAGEPADFSPVPTPEGPPFHRACWAACRTIPAGETRTYAELARMAGSSPGAARAVGQAMRCNPLPVAVPCHRVVASGGGLGGYAGSDDPHDRRLDRKRWLLANEARTISPIQFV